MKITVQRLRGRKDRNGAIMLKRLKEAVAHMVCTGSRHRPGPATTTTAAAGLFESSPIDPVALAFDDRMSYSSGPASGAGAPTCPPPMVHGAGQPESLPSCVFPRKPTAVHYTAAASVSLDPGMPCLCGVAGCSSRAALTYTGSFYCCSHFCSLVQKFVGDDAIAVLPYLVRVLSTPGGSCSVCGKGRMSGDPCSCALVVDQEGATCLEPGAEVVNMGRCFRVMRSKAAVLHAGEDNCVFCNGPTYPDGTRKTLNAIFSGEALIQTVTMSS